MRLKIVESSIEEGTYSTKSRPIDPVTVQHVLVGNKARCDPGRAIDTKTN